MILYMQEQGQITPMGKFWASKEAITYHFIHLL